MRQNIRIDIDILCERYEFDAQKIGEYILKQYSENEKTRHLGVETFPIESKECGRIYRELFFPMCEDHELTDYEKELLVEQQDYLEEIGADITFNWKQRFAALEVKYGK